MAYSLKTPLYHHLTTEDFEHIYSPSEDTFLFIDAIEKDMNTISDLKPSVCVELGTGSGVVITALASVLGSSCRYIGTDINPIACEKAAKTGELNGVCIETYLGDLTSGIPEEVKGAIDILLFNPPYVVTESEEIASGDLELTWAGGERGREVIDKLLPHVYTLLSSEGTFYLLLEKLNDPADVVNIMKNSGFDHEVILERKAHNESLSVVKFQKISQ